ncbi:PPC domain-containing DNA-binding protein [uncultured Flavobacterium sp.]|uniref:PPC domain-containing DNA-binding protein n=1 Tax=uncultured Flavobacterium sp. TaxID=165435 RepID=UPI0025E77DED|nr:PPC domain-containing DNA-binding protein [uncultured Flavobacterium sp.]
MKAKLLLAASFLFFMAIGNAHAQKTQPDIPRYVKVDAGYLMVLRQGDDILKEIEKLAVAENIPSANFTGMGFVTMTFGFYDFKAKKFDPKEFKDMELAGMHGTIAWQDGKPSIHAHGTVTGRDFKAYGGHILSGTVGTGSAEILVTVHDKKLERIKEERLGANVLCIAENCPE